MHAPTCRQLHSIAREARVAPVRLSLPPAWPCPARRTASLHFSPLHLRLLGSFRHVLLPGCLGALQRISPSHAAVAAAVRRAGIPVVSGAAWGDQGSGLRPGEARGAATLASGQAVARRQLMARPVAQAELPAQVPDAP